MATWQVTRTVLATPPRLAVALLRAGKNKLCCSSPRGWLSGCAKLAAQGWCQSISGRHVTRPSLLAAKRNMEGGRWAEGLPRSRAANPFWRLPERDTLPSTRLCGVRRWLPLALSLNHLG